MADPAVVRILCTHEQFVQLSDIPSLDVQVRPMYTDVPDVVEVSALADEAAQSAAVALGCEVTVVVSAEQYRARMDALMADDPGPVA